MTEVPRSTSNGYPGFGYKYCAVTEGVRAGVFESGYAYKACYVLPGMGRVVTLLGVAITFPVFYSLM